MIAVVGTILGFATSAVVAEVRNAERVPSAAVVSPAQSSTMSKNLVLTRYRSMSVTVSAVAAEQAPKVLPQMALAAGPNGPGERLSR
jgi:hypothetical protein